jgi:histidyl-tRNA synthetase
VLRVYLAGKKNDLSEDSVNLIDVNPLRVLDSKTDQSVLVDPPRMVDHLCDACSGHFQSVKALLESLDVPFTEDHGLVRGLDYYTRTTFEYIGRQLDTAQNAVGGGGRYDGLAETLGGRPTPGVGFALGVDRIALAVDEADRTYLDAYLVSETGPEEALWVASRLRRDGIKVDFDSEGRSVKAQFRAARRINAAITLVWKGKGEPIDVQTNTGRWDVALEEVSDWLRGQT